MNFCITALSAFHATYPVFFTTNSLSAFHATYQYCFLYFNNIRQIFNSLLSVNIIYGWPSISVLQKSSPLLSGLSLPPSYWCFSVWLSCNLQEFVFLGRKNCRLRMLVVRLVSSSTVVRHFISRGRNRSFFGAGLKNGPPVARIFMGKLRQELSATVGTKFTKPGHHFLAPPPLVLVLVPPLPSSQSACRPLVIVIAAIWSSGWANLTRGIENLTSEGRCD